jgi:hypothetical protein
MRPTGRRLPTPGLNYRILISWIELWNLGKHLGSPHSNAFPIQQIQRWLMQQYHVWFPFRVFPVRNPTDDLQFYVSLTIFFIFLSLYKHTAGGCLKNTQWSSPSMSLPRTQFEYWSGYRLLWLGFSWSSPVPPDEMVSFRWFKVASVQILRSVYLPLGSDYIPMLFSASRYLHGV